MQRDSLVLTLMNKKCDADKKWVYCIESNTGTYILETILISYNPPSETFRRTAPSGLSHPDRLVVPSFIQMRELLHFDKMNQILLQ